MVEQEWGPDDYTICGHCGVSFPMPDLAQVLYHENIPHRLIEAPTWSGARRMCTIHGGSHGYSECPSTEGNRL